MGINPRRRIHPVTTTIRMSWPLRQRLEALLEEEEISLGEFTRSLWRQALNGKIKPSAKPSKT